MATHQLVATKTASAAAKTKTSLTTEQSQKLIQTMLTMSFGCLAFLRGLFPDENFVDQRFVPEKVEKSYRKVGGSQSSSIKIKTLVRGKSNEADLLLNWLEKGVFQSIKLKYLKALSLGIFLNEDDPTDLLENYTFMFEYDSSNNFQMKVGSGKGDEVDCISLLDSRKMAQQLMRRFIIITQSLEPLPPRKFLTLRLMFNENAPPDYQPSLFRDATFDRPAVIKVPQSADMDSFSVGSLDTKHHKVSLKVLSAADCDTDDSCEFSAIDPFDLIDPLPISESQKKVSRDASVPSQTTNILGDLLKSSQPNLQPTQAVGTKGQSEVSCECGMDCPKDSTTLKVCRKCRKRVHGVCYGNYRSSSVDKCLVCVYGSQLDTASSDFKDLMLLRRCYRFIARTRTFPSSISLLFKKIFGDIELNSEMEERTAFCLTVLFLDDILVLNYEGKSNASQGSRKSYGLVDFDWPGIITAEKGELKQNQKYDLSFYYNSSKAHSCYADVLGESKNQIDGWLKEVRDLRNQLRDSLPSSCDLRSLDIRDNEMPDNAASDKKRRHVNLDQYLASSITYDTMDMRNESVLETPKKIRKISVSKKSLRSAW